MGMGGASYTSVEMGLLGGVTRASAKARPWDSPGKNTGVGCHFPLQCMKVKSESEVASDPMDCSKTGHRTPAC